MNHFRHRQSIFRQFRIKKESILLFTISGAKYISQWSDKRSRSKKKSVILLDKSSKFSRLILSTRAIDTEAPRLSLEINRSAIQAGDRAAKELPRIFSDSM